MFSCYNIEFFEFCWFRFFCNIISEALNSLECNPANKIQNADIEKIREILNLIREECCHWRYTHSVKKKFSFHRSVARVMDGVDIKVFPNYVSDNFRRDCIRYIKEIKEEKLRQLQSEGYINEVFLFIHRMIFYTFSKKKEVYHHKLHIASIAVRSLGSRERYAVIRFNGCNDEKKYRKYAFVVKVLSPEALRLKPKSRKSCVNSGGRRSICLNIYKSIKLFVNDQCESINLLEPKEDFLLPQKKENKLLRKDKKHFLRRLKFDLLEREFDLVEYDANDKMIFFSPFCADERYSDSYVRYKSKYKSGSNVTLDSNDISIEECDQEDRYSDMGGCRSHDICASEEFQENDHPRSPSYVLGNGNIYLCHYNSFNRGIFSSGSSSA